MAFNRDEALRSAEKALRLGKLDQAIAEYASIVERQPRDSSTANTLGDLYARAGQTDNAIAQYTRVAEQFFADGFYPKASALFKKILKIRPEEEQPLLRLGEIAAKQGLLADARSFLTTVAAKRRARDDAWGADDVLIELADFEGADLDARMQAARILAERGEADAAAQRLRDLAVDLLEKERPQEAVDVLREAVHLVPGDRIARKQLIGLLTDMDQAAEAEVYLTREVAEGDPAMLLALAKAELETGRLDEGREDMRAALAHAPAFADAMAFMQRLAPRHPDAGYLAAEALADAALARRQVGEAIEALRAFLHAAPSHVTGALRLVEVCLEEGLDDMLLPAQAALADAYIAAGQPEAGRVIAEDLHAAAPEDQEALDRLARARTACGLPPIEVKAERAEVPEDARAKAIRAEELWAEEVRAEELRRERVRREEEEIAPEEMRVEALRAEVPRYEARANAPETPDLEQEVPEFDIYVYGQPSVQPEESGEKGESEEEMIARLLAEEAATEDGAAAVTAPEPEVDLTASLDHLDEAPEDAPPAPLENVFEGFRQRNRVEEHDRAEAAFEEAELAAALGQTADAERLYTEASRSAPFRFRAAAALARVLLNEGRLADAIEWFERATEVPAPDADAGHALLYDLGDALERHGESMRALAVFMELNAEAGDYRGAGARVERLARAEIGG